MKETKRIKRNKEGTKIEYDSELTRTREEEKDKLEIEAKNSRYHSKIWCLWLTLLTILLFVLLMAKICPC